MLAADGCSMNYNATPEYTSSSSPSSFLTLSFSTLDCTGAGVTPTFEGSTFTVAEVKVVAVDGGEVGGEVVFTGVETVAAVVVAGGDAGVTVVEGTGGSDDRL